MKKGSKMSLESRIKMSIAHKGKKLSKEHKAKLKEILKRVGYKFPKGNIPWSKGKKFTEEHKYKLIIAKLGKHLPIEHRKHISEAQIRIGNKPPSAVGRKLSEEHKRSIYLSRIGRYLKSTEIVHHINEIITDNRPENLQLFEGFGKHLQFHKNK